MARSPFQGTFVPNLRPTIVQAPDAMVYINGESDVIGCANCKKKFPFSKYITSIQVDLNVDSVPGSASVQLSIPIHAIDDFMFDGNPIVTPMMEIEIYSKGYYLLEGIPQYYPIFWGIITEVSDDYSSGEHTVTIQCNDILKWWELCKMNINPAFTGAKGQGGTNIFGNVFFGMNPYDIIYTLAHMSFGDVVIGTGSLTSLYKENAQASTFTSAMQDIMMYWNDRFGRIRSNLLLYGVSGAAVRGEALAQTFQTGKVSQGTPVASTAVRNAGGKEQNAQFVFDPTSSDVVAFRTQGTQAGQVNFWQSEYQTKLELANAAKEAIGFEFYMDVTGDIVFKPPFYNLDILSNKPVSWIQDIDIIDWNFSDSEAEVVTQLTLQGNFTNNIDWGVGEEITPYTSVTDYHLLRKYGWRSHTYNSEFLGDTQLMFYHGLDVLDRINSKRHRGSVTIPHRPELRLGFPIYIAPKDQIWYIAGISHNIAFGGRATTTLTLTARRGKFVAPKGIGSLKMTGEVEAPRTANSSAKKSDVQRKNPNTDIAKASGKPGTKELARKKFTLDIGKAAQTPAFNYDPNDLAAADAYAPLMLQHPKTGRLVGYPNVVMVYTRPFANVSLEEFRRVSGSSRNGQSGQINKNQKANAEKKSKAALETLEKSVTDEKVQALLKQHMTNRWHYGLNTAGVFVYAHETEQVVSQFALLPVSNIEVKVQGSEQSAEERKKNPVFSKGSAMIRPVSDERGFEVVGHYRYGRGVALRDGQLVLNEGKNNEKANVSVQVALSGNLFGALHAQSQGLTTISTAYPNPADALARLLPEDLQTAATITPGEGPEKAKFVNTSENFVDSAPLGSPEQQGVPVSVEAGQLSKALTLAEMSVKEDGGGGETNCVCTVRADLAFINVGYSVKLLNPAAPETALFRNNDAVAEGVDLSAPVPQQALKFEAIAAKVETYLTNLYQTLDDVHQEYEQVLRGALTEESQREATGDFQADNPVYGDLTPPFSASNRSNLGDPVATAMQAKSSASNLKQTWETFGNNLKTQSEKFGKAEQLQQAKNELSSLQKQLQQSPGNPQIQSQIDAKQRQIQQLELEIGVR